MIAGKGSGFSLVMAGVGVVCACVGCAQGRDGANPLEQGASVEPGDVEGSVLDVVTADHLGTFDASSQELAGLIVAPASMGQVPDGDGLRLLSLQVDDPNGNGRVDDHWYEPRLRTQNCAVNVDAAPAPVAVAAFVPGDPAQQLDGESSISVLQETLEADSNVSIEVRLFDDAAQRDAFADAMLEFYAAMADFECDTSEQLGDSAPEGVDSESVTDTLMADIEEVEFYDTGQPGYAFESSGLQGDALVNTYRVGERVQLVVTVSTPGIGSSHPDGSPDPALAHQVIDAELAQLSAAGLT